MSVLLRRPQIFLLSSVGEGIALILLEAMAAGLPAVVTDVGGSREVVEPLVTGFLVPPNDPEELAAKVLTVARDRVGARALGGAGRARIESQFDLRTTVERYRSLYERQLGALSRM